MASVLFSLHISAQPNTLVTDTTIYTFVDTMPQYPGGPGAMMSYLSKSITYKSTIPCALPKLYMQFVVNAKGEITQPKASVLQNSDCLGLNDFLHSVENQLAAMPTWTPGKQAGKPVNVRLNLPLFVCMQH